MRTNPTENMARLRLLNIALKQNLIVLHKFKPWSVMRRITLEITSAINIFIDLSIYEGKFYNKIIIVNKIGY